MQGMILHRSHLHVIKISLPWLIIGILVGCQVDPVSNPNAGFSIFPARGDTATLFLFDASPSNIPSNDTWRIKVRWDWDNDGLWDTDFTLDKTATHRFHSYGDYKINLEVLDITGASDTVTGIVQVSELIKDSVIIDNRDNQSYTVKKINQVWWMTQDLAYGKIISNRSTPTDNGTAERWVYPDSGLTLQYNQGFYTELEATGYYRNIQQGICPDGWRISTTKECIGLNSYFWDQWNSFAMNDTIYRLNPVYHGYFYINTAKFHGPGQSNLYWIRQSGQIFSFAQFTHMGFSPSWWDSSMESSWENKLGKPFNRQWLGFAIRCIKPTN